jgi:GNAT superfamily N-acetyltransferase
MCTEVVEAAIRDCFLSYTALPGASRESFAIRSNVPLPYFNGVPGAVLNGDPEAAVRDVKARFREARVPFRWWITPSSTPANLIDILKAEGFRHVYDAPGMAIDLSSLADPKAIEGFVIRRVVDRPGLDDWMRVFGEGFRRPPEEWAVWRDTYLAFGIGVGAQWRHFVGYLDGAPVATTSMCVSPEIAGIYHVVTLPPARGRGIGAAITLEALHEGKRAGCVHGALQSSEMAFNVYRSIGFRKCCDLVLYDWRPEYEPS